VVVIVEWARKNWVNIGKSTGGRLLGLHNNWISSDAISTTATTATGQHHFGALHLLKFGGSLDERETSNFAQIRAA
jgi:hypothetical protein